MDTSAALRAVDSRRDMARGALLDLPLAQGLAHSAWWTIGERGGTGIGLGGTRAGWQRTRDSLALAVHEYLPADRDVYGGSGWGMRPGDQQLKRIHPSRPDSDVHTITARTTTKDASTVTPAMNFWMPIHILSGLARHRLSLLEVGEVGGASTTDGVHTVSQSPTPVSGVASASVAATFSAPVALAFQHWTQHLVADLARLPESKQGVSRHSATSLLVGLVGLVQNAHGVTEGGGLDQAVNHRIWSMVEAGEQLFARQERPQFPSAWLTPELAEGAALLLCSLRPHYRAGAKAPTSSTSTSTTATTTRSTHSATGLTSSCSWLSEVEGRYRTHLCGAWQRAGASPEDAARWFTFLTDRDHQDVHDDGNIDLPDIVHGLRHILEPARHVARWSQYARRTPHDDSRVFTENATPSSSSSSS